MSDKPAVALSDAEWAIVQKILQTYLPGCSVWAFGSRTTGRHHRFSDLDIAIIGGPALSFSAVAALREAFDESDLPWKVDIVDWHDIGDDFRRIIDAHKVRLQ